MLQAPAQSPAIAMNTKFITVFVYWELGLADTYHITISCPDMLCIKVLPFLVLQFLGQVANGDRLPIIQPDDYGVRKLLSSPWGSNTVPITIYTLQGIHSVWASSHWQLYANVDACSFNVASSN